MGDFYDGTKLLSMTDLNGEMPELYLTTGNRSIGKTTWFNRYAVKRWKEKHSKFCLVYRWNYELCDCADKFFKDIQRLFFPNDEMTEKRRANGIFVELFLNEQSCGYCVTLNNADSLKKFSHLLSDVDMIIFDEFMISNIEANDLRQISIDNIITNTQNNKIKYISYGINKYEQAEVLEKLGIDNLAGPYISKPNEDIHNQEFLKNRSVQALNSNNDTM